MALEERRATDRQHDGQDLAELPPDIVLFRHQPPLFVLFQRDRQVSLGGIVPGDLIVRNAVFGHASCSEDRCALDPGEIPREFFHVLLKLPVIEVCCEGCC